MDLGSFFSHFSIKWFQIGGRREKPDLEGHLNYNVLFKIKTRMVGCCASIIEFSKHIAKRMHKKKVFFWIIEVFYSQDGGKKNFKIKL